MATSETTPREIKPFSEVTSPLDYLLLEHVIEFCADQTPSVRVPGVIYNTLVDDRNNTTPVRSFHVGHTSTGKLYRTDLTFRDPTPLEGVEIAARLTLGFPETEYGRSNIASRTTMCARFAIIAGSIPVAVENNGLDRYTSHFGGYRGIVLLSKTLQSQFQ